MIGRSGAKIEVMDRCVYKYGGPDDLRAQAELCQKLGPPAAPRILQIGESCYYMEKLVHLKSLNAHDLARAVVRILAENVWKRETDFDDASFPDWRSQVAAHARENAPGLDGALVGSLYPRDPKCTRYNLIHGDPTFANLMRRPDGSAVLIDPVPPRATAPSLIEMDVARVLQSLYGWEHALEPERWPELVGRDFLVNQVFEWVGEWRRTRSFFWAAFNCGRIIRKNVDAASVSWARRTLPLFLEELK